MDEPADAAPVARFPAWILWMPLRVALGLFVIAQAAFVLLYNVFDFFKTARETLKDQKLAVEKRLRDEELNEEERKHSGRNYTLLHHIPGVGRLVDDWIDRDEESALGQWKKKWSQKTEWWAIKTGQEQGWRLFAPDTVRWTSFVAVEFRWDDDVEALGDRLEGKAVVALGGGQLLPLLDASPEPTADPVVVLSDNEPPDVNRFLRLGKLRLRRYESAFEMNLQPNGEAPETYHARYESDIQRIILGTSDRGQREELFLYLRWKLKTFRRQHPDLPEPRQVILRMHTRGIPAPPGPRPWAWTQLSDEPVVRWRPARHQPGSDALELYQHTISRFQSKTPTRWPTPSPTNRMPGSSD